MLLAQDIRTLDRSPQQRLVIIGAVVGIHVAVIGAFLSGLRPSSFLPEPSGPIIIKVIPDHTQPPPAPSRTDAEIFQKPVRPDADVPNFLVDNGNTIHNPGPTATNTPTNPSNFFVDARGIMGTHTAPDYPQLDKRLGHEGNVLLKLAIDERGAVVDTQVERSSGYQSLDQAAADWVRSHWRYQPATRAGDAVASNAEVTVTFRLTTH